MDRGAESKTLKRHYAVLAEIGRIIGSSLDINQVYERFAEEVRRLIPWDGIVITLADAEAGTLTTAFTAGDLQVPRREPGDVDSLEGTTTELVYRTRSGILFQTEDMDEVARRFPGLLPVFESGIRSHIGAPLIAADRVIGALNLGVIKPNAYTQDDLEMAENVAHQIAGAIANARLYTQREQTEERLQRRSQYLETMFNLGNILVQSGSFEEKANRVLVEMAEIVQAGRAFLRLPDEQARGLRTVAGGGVRTEARPAKEVADYGTSLSGMAFERGRVLVVNDLPNHPGASQAAVAQGVRSSVYLPVKARGKTLGVILVDSPHLSHFTKERVQMLEAISDGIGTLLENARLYQEMSFNLERRKHAEEQLRIANETLESRVRERTRALSIANAALKKEIAERRRAEGQLRSSREQLRALSAHVESIQEKERTGMAREIHDELGQALTGLKMDLSWLHRRLIESENGLLSPGILERITSMSEMIDGTIQTVREISTRLRPSVLDSFGLTAAIEWQAQEFQQRTGIESRVTLPPEDIRLDQERSTAIFRIFQEALTNVARHAQAAAVETRVKQEAGYLILEVRDNGRGITESELSNLDSLGLLGMRERALLMGGNVVFRGTEGRGTTVVMRIPLDNQANG